MREHWDVIIVGARCAGATLATILARRGMRVLVLEASNRGTNLPMSTHFVHAPGIDVLDRLGVGARVRAVTPASVRFRYAFDDVAPIVHLTKGREAYCIRRGTIDPWLQDTAEEAGVELRFRHRVVELLKEGGRVTGVVARSNDGLSQLHADLVVGADGVRSVVAEQAGAEEYLTAASSRAGFFTYYQAPQHWTADWDSTLEHIGSDLRYVFRCDGDQVLLTYVGERAKVAAWGDARRERFQEALEGSPTTRELVRGREPLSALTGALSWQFYYRRPVGPGFALVGDAGHFKDFVTGHGMTDAFLDAEHLAEAIIDGRDAAYMHYWRQRDVLTLPLHFDALKQGAVGFNEPFFRWVLAHMSNRPALMQRAGMLLDRKLDPGDLLPSRDLLAVLGSAILQRRVDVLRGFVQTVRTGISETRELGERKRLLADARDALAHAPSAETKERVCESAGHDTTAASYTS